MSIADNFFFKDSNGGNLYLSGVNYWHRKAGPLMWSKWDPISIGEELHQMKEMGMNVCRFFLYLPDFMPTENEVDNRMLERFTEFLDICSDEGIAAIPTLFVGHMSGEEWDFPWRNGRNLYDDEGMLERQVYFTREIVKKADNHPAICAWILSNEMPNYGGKGPEKSVQRWVSTITKAIKDAGDDRPVNPGDGAWSPEIWGEATEWHIKDIIDDVDFLGPHIYPLETDYLTHSYNPAFCIKMASVWNKPVILEEFGASNTMASEENQGGYFRATLSSVFLNGGAGALGWCYSDFDLEYQRPYSHRGFELQFGVTRVDASVKPSGEAFREFRDVLDKIDTGSTAIHEDPVAILIPTHYHNNFDYTPDDRTEMKNIFKQSFVGLKQAGMNPRFLFEDEIDWNRIESDKKPRVPMEGGVIFSPVMRRLTAPYLRALLEYVERGGVLYASYGSQGWIHMFEELFGVKHQLRFGLADLPPEGISLNFVTNFGGIPEGDALTFQKGGADLSAAYCPIEPAAADVIAVDAEGKPAITSNVIGSGRVIFSIYPLEYYTCSVNEGSSFQPLYPFYGAICKEHGIVPPLRRDNPNVELGILRSDSGEIFAYLVNHSWTEERVMLSLGKLPAELHPVAVGRGVRSMEDGALVMGAKRIGLYKIEAYTGTGFVKVPELQSINQEEQNG